MMYIGIKDISASCTGARHKFTPCIGIKDTPVPRMKKKSTSALCTGWIPGLYPVLCEPWKRARTARRTPCLNGQDSPWDTQRLSTHAGTSLQRSKSGSQDPPPGLWHRGDTGAALRSLLPTPLPVVFQRGNLQPCSFLCVFFFSNLLLFCACAQRGAQLEVVAAVPAGARCPSPCGQWRRHPRRIVCGRGRWMEVTSCRSSHARHQEKAVLCKYKNKQQTLPPIYHLPHPLPPQQT